MMIDSFLLLFQFTADFAGMDNLGVNTATWVFLNSLAETVVKVKQKIGAKMSLFIFMVKCWLMSWAAGGGISLDFNVKWNNKNN